MSEFDPRWSVGGQGDSGPDQPGESGHQGGSAPQPGPAAGQPGYPTYPGFYGQPGQPGQPGYPGQPGQEFRPGLGDPSRTDTGAWSGYTYPGGYPGQGPQGDFRQTAQFGQPGWSQQDGHWTQQYPQFQPNRQRRGHPVRSVAIAVGAIGLSVLIGLGIGRLAWPSDSASTALSGGNQDFGSTGPSGGGTSSTSINPSAIAAKVNPGLVDINTVLGYQNAEAAGTGIVLTSNGEILTNNHVVEGATQIKVTDVGDKKTYSAHVVGYDRTQDIAVLQLENASGLKTEILGDSSKLSVGDAVVGIGNAGGAGGTPSAAAGTVTALNQSITASDDSGAASERLTGLIQTDANIQSGDSGGSLVNSDGQVIGVDTAAASSPRGGSGGGFGGGGFGGFGNGGQGGSGDQGGEHQGFAIPINHAISIAHQIIAGTASSTVHIGQTAFLGVGVSDQAQDNDGFGDGQGQAQPNTASGAPVVSTVPNGPADKAGVQQGDVITSVNGKDIGSANALTNLMDTHRPGDKLSIAFTDETGQSHTVTIIPIAGPVG